MSPWTCTYAEHVSPWGLFVVRFSFVRFSFCVIFQCAWCATTYDLTVFPALVKVDAVAFVRLDTYNTNVQEMCLYLVQQVSKETHSEDRNPLLLFVRFSYDEFLCAVRGKVSGRRAQLILQAFGIMDKDKSGAVNSQDLKASPYFVITIAKALRCLFVSRLTIGCTAVLDSVCFVSYTVHFGGRCFRGSLFFV